MTMDALITDDVKTEKAPEVFETSDAQSNDMLPSEQQNSSELITQKELNANDIDQEILPPGIIYENKPLTSNRFGVATGFNSLPDGFMFRDDFIWFYNQKDDAGNYTYADIKQLCTPIAVIAKCSDTRGDTHGKVIRVHSDQRGRKQIILGADVIGVDPLACVKALMKIGLEMPEANAHKGQLANLLNRWDPGKYATIVKQGGWDSQFRYFVLGEDVYGNEELDEKIIYEGSESDDSFHIKGSFDTWYEKVARLCQGNSRFMLAMSMAFAGPLMKLTNTPSGGVHFYGDSSTGKSICGIAAGSVVGGGHPHNGFLKQWGTTFVGAEALCSQHNDLLMPMDEISQVSSDQLESIGYMFGNNVGKVRSNINIQAVAAKQWSVMMISTGEHSVADKLAEKGLKEKAGIAVRITSIAADAGAIMPDGSRGGTVERLNGYSSAAELADTIKEAALDNYGHAIRIYLQRLIDDECLKKKIEDYQNAFFDQVKDLIAGNGQAKRVAKKFSIIAAGGELAIHYEVLPWTKGSAVEATVRCFKDWLKEWGAVGGNRELYVAAEEAFAYFRTKSRDHFDGMNLLDDDKSKNPTDKSKNQTLAKKNRHGFIKPFQVNEPTAQKVLCFVMHPDDFHKHVCNRSRSEALLDLLKKRDLLLTDEVSRRKKVRVGNKTQGMIVIKCSVMDESLSE